ncbi:MAG TPA: glycosyltransferase family 39 protein [Ktedonobacteraceae bacterium]|nr:glycosyltransferase family 39 protein [Ktedonobacteraceae bacterium]
MLLDIKIEPIYYWEDFLVGITSYVTQDESSTVPEIKSVRTTQPWQRIVLGAILLLATCLNFLLLDRAGYGNTYYAAAVKSMLQSWHNFFYVSFDPGGFVTIDKPPLGFWLQALSAKIFGFSGFSLILPQALAGVFSVAVLYYLVRRIFGPGAGLLAALFLAITPISVVANRNNIVDSTLVLVVLLGAWAVSKATETGRLRWLLLCAVLIGLGFNIKMLQAYLVIPAFGLMYLLGAPESWWTRIWHLTLALLVLLTISLSWAVVVDLVPASQRPYVGSSQTNSEIELAFGYNGIERLTGLVRGAGRDIRATDQASQPPQGGVGFLGNAETGNPGPLRLFNTQLGGQTSWLLPLAILGLILAGWRAGIRLPLNRRQQSLLMWGMWLLTMGIFFSVAGFFHTYYLVMIAPAICALAAIGLIALWQEYQQNNWRGWLLSAALLITATVQVVMLLPYNGFRQILIPSILILTIVAAVLLLLARFISRIQSRRVLMTAIAIGTFGLLIAPMVWTSSSLVLPSIALIPRAGPASLAIVGFPGGRNGRNVAGFSGSPRNGQFPGAPSNGQFPGFFGGRAGIGAGQAIDPFSTADKKLEQYLLAHQGNTRYLVATTNAMSASPIILDTGKPVMALGGFSGSDPIVDASKLSAMVADGTVRYFLIPSLGFNNLPPQIRDTLEALGGGGNRGGFGGFGGGNIQAINNWVSTHCTVVPTDQWQTPSTTGQAGRFRGLAQQTLYSCGNANP